MVMMFRYSTKKFPLRFSVAMAIGIYVVAVAVAICIFAIIGTFLGKAFVLSELATVCVVGVAAGFSSVALSSHPFVRRRIAVSSVPAVVFAIVYWIASTSKPDLWLSNFIASFGIGGGAAVLYALLLLNPPVIPRVK